MLEINDIATLDRPTLEQRCKSEVQTAYLGDNKAICRILGRYKIFLDTTDHGFGCHVMLDGYWEIWLTQFLVRHVKPGMHVADVGANYGYYSVLLGDMVGSEGTLDCFEPNPAAAATLKMTLALNGFAERSTVHEIALGAGEEEAELRVPQGEPKNAHVVPVDVHGWGRPIAVRPLDTVLATLPSLDFVKIDAEGSEEAILSGMENLIRKFRPQMMLEFNAARYKDPAGFLSNLTSLYGRLEHITYAGKLQQLDVERVAAGRANYDWLLFLSNKPEK